MLRLCVASQTPLIRFRVMAKDLITKYGCPPSGIPLSLLKEGDDYVFSPGGVTRMVFPLLKQMVGRKFITNPYWVSLNPIGPERVVVDGITLEHVALKSERMRGYGLVKEAIWNIIHGIKHEPASVAHLLWGDEYSDYTYYNRICAERILKLDAEQDFDLFYIHDFQQLPTGFMLHSLKPKVFRWHIPFNETTIPAEWKHFLLGYLDSYETVIVSSRKYLGALRRFGYRGKAYHIYPYIDPEIYKRPSRRQVEEFCEKFCIAGSDRAVLVVARLDPTKGQDRAIRAIARVAKEIPEVKLILVGNGSFSSSREGLGLSKASRWLSQLQKLTRDLKIEDRVIFTGHVNHNELEAAYARSDLTVLPSVREGFGLVVLESWLYKKPVIVSSNAGISELVVDGKNGMVFNPDNPVELADKIVELLKNSELAAKLGANGLETLRECHIGEGVRLESELLIKIVEGKD